MSTRSVPALIRTKLVEEKGNSVTLQLEGVDRSYANAVRRFCISEVPSMAIDDVVILENSSVLYDEILAHRLGMVPIKTDLERYVLPEKCDCGSPLGCNKCRVLFVLDATGKEKVTTVCPGTSSPRTESTAGQRDHSARQAGPGPDGQARGLRQARKGEGAREVAAVHGRGPHRRQDGGRIQPHGRVRRRDASQADSPEGDRAP